MSTNRTDSFMVLSFHSLSQLFGVGSNRIFGTATTDSAVEIIYFWWLHLHE